MADELYGDSVYESGDAIEDAEFLDPVENLTGDDPDEIMQTGYDPPDREPYELRHPTTPAEERAGPSLEARLAAEVPEDDGSLAGAAERDAADDLPEDELEAAWRDVDPGDRVGRLVAPDEGVRTDVEKDMVARDAGPAGYATSSEEAAVHLDPDSL